MSTNTLLKAVENPEADKRIARVIEEVGEVARQTGSRAYRFVGFNGTTDVVEVRVWPDGTYKVTHCDLRGVPVGTPVPADEPSFPPQPAKKRRWFRRP